MFADAKQVVTTKEGVTYNTISINGRATVSQLPGKPEDQLKIAHEVTKNGVSRSTVRFDSNTPVTKNQRDGVSITGEQPVSAYLVLVSPNNADTTADRDETLEKLLAFISTADNKSKFLNGEA